MCDYSLEMYQSRPAVAGEEYKTARFPSGSIGVVAAGQVTEVGSTMPGAVAVCLNCDQKLRLENISDYARNVHGVPESADVTFFQRDPLDGGYQRHRDAVRFPDGKELTLQQLMAGVTVSLVDDPVEGLAAVREYDEAAAR